MLRKAASGKMKNPINEKIERFLDSSAGARPRNILLSYASNALWDNECRRAGAIETLTRRLETEFTNTGARSVFSMIAGPLALDAIAYLRIDLKALAEFLIDTVQKKRGEYTFRFRVSAYYQQTIKAKDLESARKSVESGAAIPAEFWKRLFALEQEFGLTWYAQDIDVLDSIDN